MDAYTLSLKLRMDGFEEALAKLNQVDDKGKRVAASAGTNLQRIATRATGVGSAIAAAGEVGVSAMQKIVNATTSVAFAFGPAGAIVGAVGVAALAIVSLFTKSREELVKTANLFRAELRSIRSMSAASGAEALNRAVTGDVLSDSFLGRFSKSALERARTNLLVQMNANIDAKTGLVTSTGTEAQRKTLEQLNAELEKRNRILREGLPLVIANAVAEGRAVMMGGRDTMETLAAAGAVPQVRGTMPGVTLARNAASGREAMRNVMGGAGIPGLELAKEIMAALEEQAAMMRSQITSLFGDAIVNGFQAAFSGRGIRGAFAALGKSILSGLGSIFMQMGEKMVAASALMIAFQKAITSFLPGGGLIAGLALMALGGAMMAAGGHTGASGGGAAGGGYGGSPYNNATEDVTRVRLFPGWAQEGSNVERSGMYVFAPTIIGTGDPKAQRELIEMYDKGRRQRG